MNSGSVIESSTRHSPTVSIALATYNGERFLSEQLASINAQTRSPDELVIVDDNSIDETASIVEAFKSTSLIHVRYVKNEARLGYVKNFERAVKHCNGDIIFLCDQDDVWLPQKIERVLEVFADNPAKHAVINDAKLVSATLQDSGLTKLGQIRNSGQSLNQFVTGCCTAISADFKRQFLPIPDDVFVHDTWLHALAIALDTRIVLNEILQHYRRHETNSSQANHSQMTRLGRSSVYKDMASKNSLEYAERRKRRTHHLSQRLGKALKDRSRTWQVLSALQKLEVAERMVEARIQLLKKPRILRLVPAIRLASIGGYGFFSGWRSFLKDLLVA